LATRELNLAPNRHLSSPIVLERGTKSPLAKLVLQLRCTCGPCTVRKSNEE
jgi:hypothetical protein